MKIKYSLYLRESARVALLLACLIAISLSAQTPAEPTEEEALAVDPRPKESDKTNFQLIKNYLAATGGESSHRAIQNVVAEGTIRESSLIRNFKLIETNDGKRHLTYDWKHLGRKHRVVYACDGLEIWTQVLEPKELPPKLYGSPDGVHFTNVRWLLQPFTLPTKADYVFKYQGAAKVGSRPTYVVKEYGKKNIPICYYFDKEKFLVARWGGKGQVAGVEENMDYHATSFRSIDGVLFPSKIDLIVENASFGNIEFNSALANQDLSEISFLIPKTTVPTLRQSPVTSN